MAKRVKDEQKKVPSGLKRISVTNGVEEAYFLAKNDVLYDDAKVKNNMESFMLETNKLLGGLQDPGFDLVITSFLDEGTGVHKGKSHANGTAVDLRINPSFHKNVSDSPEYKFWNDGAGYDLRTKYGVKMINPYHGTAPHFHLELDDEANQLASVLPQDQGKALTDNVNATRIPGTTSPTYFDSAPDIQKAYVYDFHNTEHEEKKDRKTEASKSPAQKALDKAELRKQALFADLNALGTHRKESIADAPIAAAQDFQQYNRQPVEQIQNPSLFNQQQITDEFIAEKGGTMGGVIPKYNDGGTHGDGDDKKKKAGYTQRALKEYSNFFLDPTNKFAIEKFKGIHNRTGKPVRKLDGSFDRDEETGEILYDGQACAAGAYTCTQQLVDARLGTPSVRSSLYSISDDARNTPYSLPSGDGSSDDAPLSENASFDTWEASRALIGEGKATSYWKKGSEDEIKYKSVPLGAIITMSEYGGGNDYLGGDYLDENETIPRHTTEVVAFDKKDGMPLVFDYGEITRLDELDISYSNTGIQEIVIPNQYEGLDYNTLSKKNDERNVDLGIANFKRREVAPGAESEDVLRGIYSATDDMLIKLANDFNIPIDTLKQMQDATIGIGLKETNLNNFGNADISDARAIYIDKGDTPYSNSVLKPMLKTAKNSDLFKDYVRPLMDVYDGKGGRKYSSGKYEGKLEDGVGVPDYKIQMVANSMFKKGDNKGMSENDIYNTLRAHYPSPDQGGSTDSSVGAFKIKDFPEYLTTDFGITKDMLMDSADGTRTKEEKVLYGSMATMVHLAENFSKYRKDERYLDKTNAQYLDMAIIGFNSSAKLDDPAYVEFFIDNKTGIDNYMSTVKDNAEEVTGNTIGDRAKTQQEDMLDYANEKHGASKVPLYAIDSLKQGEQPTSTPDQFRVTDPIKEEEGAITSKSLFEMASAGLDGGMYKKEAVPKAKSKRLKDYLAMIDTDNTPEAKKELADKMGIEDYTGTTQQNVMMMENIKLTME